jgi:hypothetical protein
MKEFKDKWELAQNELNNIKRKHLEEFETFKKEDKIK